MGYDARLGRGDWKKARLYILERDGWRCQVNGPRCTAGATCVDHIVARVDGGDFYNPDNLRAACRACNAAGGAAQTNSRRRPAPSPSPAAPVEPLGPFRIF